MHLLTREALAVYRPRAEQDGLLLIHISNRYLDLEPVLAEAAKARRLARGDLRICARTRARRRPTPHLGLGGDVARSATRC